MEPINILYGVAYVEKGQTDSIMRKRVECDYERPEEIVQRAISLLDAGYYSVTMFQYNEGFDTSLFDWAFIKENEYLPMTRDAMLSFLQNMHDHNNSLQRGGQYPQSGFQSAEEEKEWFSTLLEQTIASVKESNEVGYHFMEEYYGKHPQAQGYRGKENTGSQQS